MVSKRQLAVLLTLPLLTGVSIGEASITPPQYFTSPLYWLGLFFFGLIGALLLGAKSRLIQKYSATGSGILLISLAFASRRFPDALIFAFGFLGLIVGIGLRILYWASFQAKWFFCQTCQKSGWGVKKEGEWYCDKGHALVTVK